jgi:GNAT superfamily N-acetyltransferase
VTCFVTRAGYRRRGISRALARATVDFARERGIRTLEGSPMLAKAGFAEVSRPTLRRLVMCIDF